MARAKPAVAEKPTVDLESSKSYQEGKAAYGQNMSNSDNPYPSGHGGMNDDRYHWFMGWFDAKLYGIGEKHAG